MKFHWQIEEVDVQRIQAIVSKYDTNELVKERKRRNLAVSKPTLSREIFWSRLVACLLTTQQRSGPDAPISHFLNLSPFPLRLSECEGRKDLVEYASTTLKEFGGIRFTNKIPKELAKNIGQLNDQNWL
ncbi:MAG: hypothetical protein O7G85_09405, partial [Planctomycetota bacterium]|nr:hypothetical protein [Planctomycetota bacterium]